MRPYNCISGADSYHQDEDIDLHRVKCSVCGGIGYYSSRARAFFEDGIECETYGLTTYNLLKYDGLIPRDYEKF
jgi:hypothetical protein